MFCSWGCPHPANRQPASLRSGMSHRLCHFWQDNALRSVHRTVVQEGDGPAGRVDRIPVAYHGITCMPWPEHTSRITATACCCFTTHLLTGFLRTHTAAGCRTRNCPRLTTCGKRKPLPGRQGILPAMPSCRLRCTPGPARLRDVGCWAHRAAAAAAAATSSLPHSQRLVPSAGQTRRRLANGTARSPGPSGVDLSAPASLAAILGRMHPFQKPRTASGRPSRLDWGCWVRGEGGRARHRE